MNKLLMNAGGVISGDEQNGPDGDPDLSVYFYYPLGADRTVVDCTLEQPTIPHCNPLYWIIVISRKICPTHNASARQFQNYPHTEDPQNTEFKLGLTVHT